MINHTTWIKVSDRLPDKDEEDSSYSITVLISDGQNIGIGYYEFEYFAENPDEPLQYSSDVWHDDSNLLFTDYGGWPKVTHWMPLPTQPEE